MDWVLYNNHCTHGTWVYCSEHLKCHDCSMVILELNTAYKENWTN